MKRPLKITAAAIFMVALYYGTITQYMKNNGAAANFEIAPIFAKPV